MGVTLSSAAVACANKVDGDGAYLALLEIIIPGEAEHIYLVRNNEDIYWRNQLWQAFPFTLSDRKDDNKGTLSNIIIDVDNSTRDLEYYLNQGGGGAGSKVILRCVRSDDLTATEPDFEEYFSVKSTTVTESKVSFSWAMRTAQKAAAHGAGISKTPAHLNTRACAAAVRATLLHVTTH